MTDEILEGFEDSGVETVPRSLPMSIASFGSCGFRDESPPPLHPVCILSVYIRPNVESAAVYTTERESRHGMAGGLCETNGRTNPSISMIIPQRWSVMFQDPEQSNCGRSLSDFRRSSPRDRSVVLWRGRSSAGGGLGRLARKRPCGICHEVPTIQYAAFLVGGFVRRATTHSR